jgi:hypothetical protein
VVTTPLVGDTVISGFFVKLTVLSIELARRTLVGPTARCRPQCWPHATSLKLILLFVLAIGVA